MASAANSTVANGIATSQPSTVSKPVRDTPSPSSQHTSSAEPMVNPSR